MRGLSITSAVSVATFGVLRQQEDIEQLAVGNGYDVIESQWAWIWMRMNTEKEIYRQREHVVHLQSVGPSVVGPHWRLLGCRDAVLQCS